MRRLLLAALCLTVLAACSNGGEDPHPPRTTSSTRVERTTTTEDEDDGDDRPRETTTTVQLSGDVLTPTFPPVVAGLGDSLLAGAAEEIEAGIEDEVRLVVEALQGLEIQDAFFALERVKRERPAGTAVVLGTNNATDGPDTDDVPSVGRLMADLSRLPCVRWVEVTTSGPSETFNGTARAINEELHRQAAQYATVDIIPWADAVAAHPEWVIFDGIHHTPAGEAALADAILDALAACPQTLIRR